MIHAPLFWNSQVLLVSYEADHFTFPLKWMSPCDALWCHIWCIFRPTLIQVKSSLSNRRQGIIWSSRSYHQSQKSETNFSTCEPNIRIRVTKVWPVNFSVLDIWFSSKGSEHPCHHIHIWQVHLSLHLLDVNVTFDRWMWYCSGKQLSRKSELRRKGTDGRNWYIIHHPWIPGR